MAEIIPAILPETYRDLVDKLDIVAGHAKTVQVDICDGGYVPTKTWPYLKGPLSEDSIFEEIISQEQALPHWDIIDFEFDLMVRDPHSKIPDFIAAGAKRIVVHKASVSEEELDAIIADYGKHSEELGPFDVELGLALKPTDEPVIPEGFHFVQVMGIEHEGFQGQDFDPKAIELIKGLRAAYPHLIIAIDGGVNLDTGRELINAGADRLIVGSALFEDVDFSGTLTEFKAL